MEQKAYYWYNKLSLLNHECMLNRGKIFCLQVKAKGATNEGEIEIKN